MKKFKIRASACGDIMTNPRSKSDLLSKTAQDYIQIWMKEQIYNRKKEIRSKYMSKGILNEEEAINLYANYYDLGLLIKNEEHFEDEFMTGTPDLITKDKIVDIKCSWSWETFPLFETEVPKNYFYQGQIYMHLALKEKFELVYVLTDTPDYMIEKECNAFCWSQTNDKNEADMLFAENITDFIQKMTYDDVDMDLRIKKFSFDYDINVIEQIQNRVLECRTYIKSYENY